MAEGDAVQFVHSFKVNCQLLSVQAGMIGGGILAALGAYSAYAAANPAAYHVPDNVAGALTTIGGIATALGVFFGRLAPQPGIKSDGKS